MSEKVTFGELIESIAEETEHSKQFTHDFLKDFVGIINDGLEEDGKVNIAGFGKFKLRRVDERGGFNPQTEEKITIPEHNKVVFKPYKDLRELVNAPYAHMEPTLIEEEENSSEQPEADSSQHQPSETNTDTSGVDNINEEETGQNDDSAPGDQENTENAEEPKQSEDDFIPTAPPTSFQEDNHTEQDKQEAEKEEESPFDFGYYKDTHHDPQKSTSSSSELPQDDNDNGDIVEFGADQPFEEEGSDEDFFDEFIGSEEHEPKDNSSEVISDQEETELESNKQEEIEQEQEPEQQVANTPDEHTQEKESNNTEEEILAEEVEKLETTAKNLKQDQSEDTVQEQDKEPPISDASVHRPTERSSSFIYVAAAAIILLLIAGGAWYYSSVSTSDTTMISSSQQTFVPAETGNQEEVDNDNNQQLPDNKQNTGDTQQNSNQSPSTTSPVTANNQATSQTPSNSKEDVQIEKGQTLWSLAKERYGNPRLWPWIYGNNGRLEDPDLIYAGSSLSVPLPSGPQNTLTGTDSVGVAKGFIATYKWYKSNEQSKAKNHLWAAKLYHNDLQQLADVPIDKTDLSYANRAR